MKRLLATSCILTLIISIACILAFPSISDAIPAFARKHSVDCSTCHIAWPQLNKIGRNFKENGYKFSTGEDIEVISDFLQWEKFLPVSAVLTSRPYDEKKSGSRKVRALHEVELMIAGVLYKNVSGFFELEGEDENDFEPEIPTGVLGYHPLRQINLHLSYSPILWSDPYETFAPHRRLTRGSYSIIDRPFGGADNGGTLGESRQTIALSGRPIEMLFYSVGLSGVADDAEGENANNLHARIALDVLPDAALGLFGVSGRWEEDDINRDFSRIGFDVQADYSNMRFTGAYLHARDDSDTGAVEENDAWYAQAFYVFRKGFRPVAVPLVRFDSYEENDGNDQYDELTLNLSYYFTQNIKGYAEYWTQTDKPEGVERDNRFTLQIVAAF